MIIRSAAFVSSSTSVRHCPPADKPEFAFIGRSNVGKSSIINMLTGWSRLARTSSDPGKTRTINHFLINGSWYLVDLPGYGYAKVSRSLRNEWMKSVEEYILKRENLACLFVLIDSRHEPQRQDLDFMEFLGTNELPFARIFTKTDKTSTASVRKTLKLYDTVMLEDWEALPPTFISSAVKKEGRKEILDFIEETINKFSNSG
ncbi:MAG TPA: ribosome biogenesis GTP-binding protein YihA/YsxC [Bacteroidales bacterium]|jgi:GTP-binding protein|nr:YihA family ribosome biogenesis GTP-binding protein [Bacteroidales bacterium]HNR42982.1 ribosome biogenesis GTP-binding protein YihA/YsxC [Bacteroidales bacterium]HPM18830.1 ribosome biogenesis GTP-binding protein YihA/YsxC [Bacteroidales bacterium]HQG77965.1 ribosome biogenesis GTP-binding protein YihA/YsxC [Bacteroidales bacterium]